MTGAEARRSRMLCRVAAVVFAGCGLLVLAAPLSLPVRLIVAGLNIVVAIAVLLYANSFRAES